MEVERVVEHFGFVLTFVTKQAPSVIYLHCVILKNTKRIEETSTSCELPYINKLCKTLQSCPIYVTFHNLRICNTVPFHHEHQAVLQTVGGICGKYQCLRPQQLLERLLFQLKLL
jgi:hypothetical protein